MLDEDGKPFGPHGSGMGLRIVTTFVDHFTGTEISEREVPPVRL